VRSTVNWRGNRLRVLAGSRLERTDPPQGTPESALAV